MTDFYDGPVYAESLAGEPSIYQEAPNAEKIYAKSVATAREKTNVTTALLDDIDRQVNSLSGAVSLINAANLQADGSSDPKDYQKLEEIVQFITDTFITGVPLWRSYLVEMKTRKTHILDNIDDDSWKFMDDQFPMSRLEKLETIERIMSTEGELARIKQAVEDEMEKATRLIDERGTHGQLSEAFARLDSRFDVTPKQPQTVPVQPSFNSAPPASYSNTNAQAQRDAFDDLELDDLAEVPTQFSMAAAGGTNLNRAFDRAEQQQLEADLDLDIVSNLETAAPSPFQQLPKAPPRTPDPPNVSREIENPKASLKSLDQRMTQYQKLTDSPIRAQVQSRLPPGSAPPKYTVVPNVATAIDGATQSDLYALQTYMEQYLGVQKLSNTSSQRMIKNQAKQIEDLVPRNGFRAGDWYKAVRNKQGITGVNGTKIDYETLSKDPYFKQYSDLVTSIENLKSSAGL